MACDIDLAYAQLKLWDYNLFESVHSPIYSPKSSDGVHDVQTQTKPKLRARGGAGRR